MKFIKQNTSYDLDLNGNQKIYDLEQVFEEHFNEHHYGESGYLEEFKYKINHVESLLVALIEIMPPKAKIRLAENLGFSYIADSENKI